MENIPIEKAKEFAEAHGCRQIIVLGYDGKRTFITTWGKTKEDCAQAAKAQDHWNGTRIMPHSDIQDRNVSASELGDKKDLATLERVCDALNSLDQDAVSEEDWVELPDVLSDEGRNNLLAILSVMVYRAD